MSISERMFLSLEILHPNPYFACSEIGRAILKVVYNYEAQPDADPFVALADDCKRFCFLRMTPDKLIRQIAMFHLVMGMQPGRFLADYFTFLKYVPAWAPGAYFVRYAKEGAELATRLRNSLFDVVKADVVRIGQPKRSENSFAHEIVIGQGNCWPIFRC